MTNRRLPILLSMGLLLGLGGCQHVNRLGLWMGAHLAGRPVVKVTAVAAATPQRTADATETALYEQAVVAINQRDYGRALDVLQFAREAKADDPRVLTAMGVVYDKLGRFDLSKRYYDLAEAQDPGSKIVAADRSYSLVLQQRVDGAHAPASAQLADARPIIVIPGTEPAKISVSADATPDVRAGVRVRNATGRVHGADIIRDSLAGKGWHVSSHIVDLRKASASTRVRFPLAAKPRAIGLARTLPVPVEMEVCSGCNVVELFIGSDALPKGVSGRGSDGGRG